MEDEIFNQDLGKPIYKKSHLQLATFFGGPLAIVYILAENFKVFGDREKVRKTWVIGIIVCLLFFAAAAYLSTIMSRPSLLVPIICIIIGTAIMQSWQVDDIEAHIHEGGPVYPIMRAIVIGLACLLVTVMLAVFIAMLSVIFLGVPAKHA